MADIEPKRLKFKVRIVYKNGYTHDFWVYSFSAKNNHYEWESAEVNNMPIALGVDDISSIWQVGVEI